MYSVPLPALSQVRFIQRLYRLLRLPADLWEAIVLRFYDDRSFEEIARISRISLSLAKMRVYRGLEKLQGVMKQPFR